MKVTEQQTVALGLPHILGTGFFVAWLCSPGSALGAGHWCGESEQRQPAGDRSC